jgi:hypothetical protein
MIAGEGADRHIVTGGWLGRSAHLGTRVLFYRNDDGGRRRLLCCPCPGHEPDAPRGVLL